MFVTSYLQNAKKFSVNSQPARTDGCTEFVIETFDKVSFIVTANQLQEIARVASLAAGGTHCPAAPRVPRQGGYAPAVDRPDDTDAF